MQCVAAWHFLSSRAAQRDARAQRLDTGGHIKSRIRSSRHRDGHGHKLSQCFARSTRNENTDTAHVYANEEKRSRAGGERYNARFDERISNLASGKLRSFRILACVLQFLPTWMCVCLTELSVANLFVSLPPCRSDRLKRNVTALPSCEPRSTVQRAHLHAGYSSGGAHTTRPTRPRLRPCTSGPQALCPRAYSFRIIQFQSRGSLSSALHSFPFAYSS